MKLLPVDEMLENKISRYPLVIGVAKRAREIINNYNENEKILEGKAVNMALEEFKNHEYLIVDNEV